MFETKRRLLKEIDELRSENNELRNRLVLCNNLQSLDLRTCKDFHCIGCKYAVVPDDKLPVVVLGCKIGGSCANFEPNELYKKFHYDRGSNPGNEPQDAV